MIRRFLNPGKSKGKNSRDRAKDSFQREVYSHRRKIAKTPDSLSKPHWEGEVTTFEGNKAKEERRDLPAKQRKKLGREASREKGRGKGRGKGKG